MNKNIKHEIEANEVRFTIVGSGRDSRYRKYECLDCGTMKEMTMGNVRKGYAVCNNCNQRKNRNPEDKLNEKRTKSLKDTKNNQIKNHLDRLSATFKKYNKENIINYMLEKKLVNEALHLRKHSQKTLTPEIKSLIVYYTLLGESVSTMSYILSTNESTIKSFIRNNNIRSIVKIESSDTRTKVTNLISNGMDFDKAVNIIKHDKELFNV